MQAENIDFHISPFAAQTFLLEILIGVLRLLLPGYRSPQKGSGEANGCWRNERTGSVALCRGV